MTATDRRFVFGPLERRGLLLGLSAVQLGALVGAALFALLVVRARPDGPGLITGFTVAGSGLVAACLPFGGRPPVAWIPIVVGWMRRRRRGPAFDPLPKRGWTGVEGGGGPDSRQEPSGRRTELLGFGVEILPVPPIPGQSPLAVLRDRLNGTYAAVLPVRGRAFALLDPAEKERRLSAWGSVLAGVARSGSPIHRVQWVERSFSGDGEALGRYLAEAAPLAAGSEPIGPEHLARAAYADLIAIAGPATLEHESLVVIAVHPRRASRALRSFGRGPDAIIGLLGREVRLLQGQLRQAELVAGDPFDELQVASALRSAVDPGARRRAVRTGGIGRAGAWPLATDEAWSSFRADATWYATFWIAEWPRIDVGPDFLAPLLLAAAHRTVSVTMEPVPPERARRQVEAARTADAADEELRQRAGFLPTARRRREAEGVAQRETELADGHAEFRFSGYVTVSGEDRATLEASCAEIEQVARQARLELRRLYGQQQEAFTWTLPLARGLA